MSQLVTWWRALSGPAKFRLYTRLTFHVAIVVVVVAMIATVAAPWSMVMIVFAGLVTLVAMDAQPDLATFATVVSRRWAATALTVTLSVLWLVAAVMVRVAADEAAADEARTVGMFAMLLAALALVPFLRHKWRVLLVISLATGLVFGQSWMSGLLLAAVVAATGFFVAGTTLLTVWGLRVVDELEHAKRVEAELQVAEERLRFARDLHDVVGRGFSAIAVKSELAVALSRAGDTERATAEMDEVKTLAVESMGQMRTLVRGYRNIDLRGEVAGARSLLSAVGCRLVVEGDAAKVPRRCHEVAAWVVREGTTNIVEHSSATTATLTLGAAGMSLRNNRPHGTAGERSGLRGLAERLAAVGAGLDVVASEDNFTLEIHWEKS
ncbi:sensor histidine kinase [Nocardia mangyaensis]|uniref:sensor histidine kinase n=1 Tax=Nocardia mangyaensis TaxID=2213200 RepID=UPI0026748269|nr:histidine kinase [Nocardia mangyaensis]MDO3648619.1 histidine kinase [Nocardia mangyaensis]